MFYLCLCPCWCSLHPGWCSGGGLLVWPPRIWCGPWPSFCLVCYWSTADPWHSKHWWCHLQHIWSLKEFCLYYIQLTYILLFILPIFILLKQYCYLSFIIKLYYSYKINHIQQTCTCIISLQDELQLIKLQLIFVAYL